MLPHEIVEKNPRLCLAQAWVCVYTGNIGACRQVLEACETALGNMDDQVEDVDIIRGQLLGVKAYAAWFDGDITAAESSAREALTILPESDTMGRTWSAEILGAMLRTQGAFEEAQQHLAHAIEISSRAGAFHIAIDALWEMSVLTYYRGHLEETMKICQQALDLANQSVREGGRRLPVVGYIFTRMALVHWARGELDRAMEDALEGTRLSERWGFMDVLAMSYNALARVQSSHGEYDQALHTLHRSKSIASDLSTHYYETVEALEALVNLQHDNLSAALDWVNRGTIHLDESPNFLNIQEYRILAHVHVAQALATRKAVTGQVIKLLEHLESMCDAVGAFGQSIEALLTLALAFHTNGQDKEALTKLEKALGYAQPEHYIQPFIHARDPLLEYFRVLHRQNKHTNFIDQILQQGVTTQKSTVSKRAALLLVEALSERELDILRYLPSQLSTNEIAEELFIATSTVRSHIKSIYGKLAVHSRREAVVRAEELDLL
jgi:LuxR family maltose regulon positive regulatory protein